MKRTFSTMLKSSRPAQMALLAAVVSIGAAAHANAADWKKIPNAAQYKGADWSTKVGPTMNNMTVDSAKQQAEADPNISFFFICRSGMYLETLGQAGRFQPNDAVFFTGKPWYGSAPQCDAYEKASAKPCQADIEKQEAIVSGMHAKYSTMTSNNEAGAKQQLKAQIALEQSKLDGMKQNCS